MVIVLAVTFFYFASSLCITILLAAFLAILAEPLVALLERLHLLRSVSAALVIMLGMVLVGATLYVFYDRGTAFIDALIVGSLMVSVTMAVLLAN